MASPTILAVLADGVCTTSIGGVLGDATVQRANRWQADGAAGGKMVKFRAAGRDCSGWMARAGAFVVVLEADAALVTDRVAAAVLHECTALLGVDAAGTAPAPTVAGGRSLRSRLEAIVAKYCGDGVAEQLAGSGGGDAPGSRTGHVAALMGGDAGGGDGVGAAVAVGTSDSAAFGAGAALAGGRRAVVDPRKAKWDAVESELNNIKAAAVDSIGLLVDRGEKLDSLVTRSDTLVTRSTAFRKAAITLERVERWDVLRGYACLCATAAVAIVVLVIALW